MGKEELEKLVQQLGAQVAALNARLAALEQQEQSVEEPEAAAPPEPQPQMAPPPQEEPISEEVLLAISAAVAAFLGKRAHIRAVRLIGTTRWSQEGRVSIQASHRLERG